MNRVKLKPAPGRRVRNPQTGAPLDDGGETVDRTVFWERRIADEDVIVVGKIKES